MRTAALILFVLALASGSFGYWGQHTPSGREAFDEMAGILPQVSAWASLVLAAAALVTGWVAWRGSRG